MSSNVDVLQELSKRYDLRQSEDWTAFTNHFDFGVGFSLNILLVIDNDGADVCREELYRFLALRDKRLVEIAITEEMDLRQIARRLLECNINENDGAIWVDKAVPVAVDTYSVWRGAWREGAARLNEVRNSLQRHLSIPLILVGSPWLAEVLRDMAPDLWSIRTLVSLIEPHAAWDIRKSPANFHALREYQGFNPELALKQAEGLRGVPGKELTLARLLFRAGLGLANREEWKQAAQLARDSLNYLVTSEDLYERADVMYLLAKCLAALDAFGEALLYFREAGTIYKHLNAYRAQGHCLWYEGEIALGDRRLDDAVMLFEESMELHHKAESVLGLAFCFVGLARVEEARMQQDNAAKFYKTSKELFLQAGDVLGAASTLCSMAYLSRAASDLASTEALFNEALKLFSPTGDTRGIASCYEGLGDVAQDRMDFSKAHASYTRALQLYASIRDRRGEASCTLELGRLARRRGNLASSDKYLLRSKALYHRSGKFGGEADALTELAQNYTARGQDKRARELFRDAGALYEKAHNSYGVFRNEILRGLISEKDEREKLIGEGVAGLESIGRRDLANRIRSISMNESPGEANISNET